MLKKETIYGVLELLMVEDGFRVKSDIPFFQIDEFFPEDKLKEAKSFYKRKESELNEIIIEMEKKRRQSVSFQSPIRTKITNLIDKGMRKILLYGPTGTGKTQTLYNICKDLVDRGEIEDFLLFTLSSGMEDIDLLGKYIPQSDRSLKFVPSELLTYLEFAKESKIAVIFDEFNRTHPKALNVLIPLLDEKDDHIRINNFITGKVEEIPAENMLLFFTANFGASYGGTFQIDDALYNRFDAVVFVDYQEDLEKAILKDFACKDAVLELTKFLRKLWREKNTINPVTTRDVKNMAILIEPNYPCDEDKFIKSIEPILIHKLVKYDLHGYPDEDTIAEIVDFVKSDAFEGYLR